MQEDSTQVSSPQTENAEAPKKKSNTPKNIMLFLLVVILVLAAAVGAYMYRDQKAKTELNQKQSQIDQLNKKVTDLQSQLATAQKTSTPTSTSTTTVNPSASTVENVKAAITSGNTAALEGYMASSVNVVVAASEKAGARTPAQAISDLSYVNDAKSWNFALDTATLNSYKAGFYKDYFKSNSVVGKANNGKVIVFNFNSQGKIDGTFLAASDTLLTE